MKKDKKEKKVVEMKVCRFCGKAYKADRKCCPKCCRDEDGEFHGYKPMDENKIKKIRIIVGVVLLAVFIVLFVILKLK